MLKKVLIATTVLSLGLGGSIIQGIVEPQHVYAAAKVTDSSLVKSGNDLYKKAKYNEAIAAADKALALNSANGDAYYLKGLSYAKLKKPFESKANYEKAAFANPTKYYPLVMSMKLNEKTGELSNTVFGLKITPAADWYYFDAAGIEEVTDISKTLNANKKMSQSEVEIAISGGWAMVSIHKEDPSVVEGSSSLMAMIEPVYMDKTIKTVDDYIKIIGDGLKEAEGFKSITAVEKGTINKAEFKSFAVIYEFDGIEVVQYYYFNLKDKFIKVFVLTPTSDEDLDVLEQMLRTVK